MHEVLDQAIFERIRQILASAVGPSRGVTIDRLAEMCHTHRRKIETIIECRLEDFRFPIVSGDFGYCRATRAEDLNAYHGSLMSRIRCIGLRIVTTRRLARAAGFVWQHGRFVSANADLFEAAGSQDKSAGGAMELPALQVSHPGAGGCRSPAASIVNPGER